MEEKDTFDIFFGCMIFTFLYGLFSKLNILPKSKCSHFSTFFPLEKNIQSLLFLFGLTSFRSRGNWVIWRISVCLHTEYLMSHFLWPFAAPFSCGPSLMPIHPYTQSWLRIIRLLRIYLDRCFFKIKCIFLLGVCES